MLRWGLCAGVQCFWEGGRGRRGGRERMGVQLELLSRLWWINPRAPGGHCLANVWEWQWSFQGQSRTRKPLCVCVLKETQPQTAREQTCRCLW